MQRALFALALAPLVVLAAPAAAQQELLVLVPRAAPPAVHIQVDVSLELEAASPPRPAADRHPIGAILAGAAVLAAGYGVAAAWPSLTDAASTGITLSAIPLVGPFLTLAQDGAEPLERAGLALLGVAQLAGLATLIVGVVLVRSDRDREPPSLYVVPAPGGAVVAGRF